MQKTGFLRSVGVGGWGSGWGGRISIRIIQSGRWNLQPGRPRTQPLQLHLTGGDEVLDNHHVPDRIRPTRPAGLSSSRVLKRPGEAGGRGSGGGGARCFRVRQKYEYFRRIKRPERDKKAKLNEFSCLLLPVGAERLRSFEDAQTERRCRSCRRSSASEGEGRCCLSSSASTEKQRW